MSESLLQFSKEHPFWAVFIVVFMILPMIGAVLHIVLKALGRKGIDNSPPGATLQVLRNRNGKGDVGAPDSSEPRQTGDESRDPGRLRADSGG